jgi:hypothetical protein
VAPAATDENPTPPPPPLGKYFTGRCVFLHVSALLGLLCCVVFASWQYRSSASKTTGGGYVLAWTIFGIYIIYMWWKLIHQAPVPFDKDWAIKARAKAEAAGVPLTEIPGWAKDKDLRRAVIAMSREQPEALALPYTSQTYMLETFDQKVARAMRSGTPILAETASVDSEPGDDLSDDASTETSDGNEPDRVIEARAIASTPIVDKELEELEAYNRYLFELSEEDRAAHRRKSDEPPTSH